MQNFDVTTSRPTVHCMCPPCHSCKAGLGRTKRHCLLKWFGSYLSNRCQRVRVGQLVSSWKTLSGGMLTWYAGLGPLSFIVLIDDLRAACEVHNFVDDTTFPELIPSTGSVSNMPSHLTSLLTLVGGVRRFWQQVVVVSCGFILEKVPQLTKIGRAHV